MDALYQLEKPVCLLFTKSHLKGQVGKFKIKTGTKRIPRISGSIGFIWFWCMDSSELRKRIFFGWFSGVWVVFDLDVVNIVGGGAGRSCVALINIFWLDEGHTTVMRPCVNAHRPLVSHLRNPELIKI